MLEILEAECKKLHYTARDVQVEAVKWLSKVWDSDNACKVLSIPVGGGKSLIAKVIAEYNKKRGLYTAIITPQNLLIDQYISEFKDINYFKGKTHYFCEKTQDSCETGMELRRVLKESCLNCPYQSAKERCYQEAATIFNPISYFTLPKIEKSECIYEADTIVIDEMQSLPTMLRDLTTIKLWAHDIKWKKGVSSSIPSILVILETYYNNLSQFIKSENIDKKEKLKLIHYQRKIYFTFTQIERNPSYFICEESREKYRNTLTACLIIRPKYVPPSVYKNFFKFAKRVVLMSGTAFSYTWEELGFKKIDFIDLPSPIPVERRQVIITNTVNLNAKQSPVERCDNIALLVEQIKHIVDNVHPTENGVVILSYNLAEEIKEFLHEPHYVHMDKKCKSKVIEQFKESTERKVAIIPGGYEGLSLDDDISRFTIIPKVTYANLMDNVIKIRAKEKPFNYLLETMTTLIQATGRSSRSENDFSTIYILDKNFSKIYSKTRAKLPQYFKESLVFKGVS